MTPAQLYDVAHAFLDAVERGDMDAVRAIYAPELRFWANVTDHETSGEDNIAKQVAGKKLARRRTYDDRHIDVFDGGFLARYSVSITTLDGARLALWASFVAICDPDGGIVRIDEYLDAGKLPSRQAARTA